MKIFGFGNGGDWNPQPVPGKEKLSCPLCQFVCNEPDKDGFTETIYTLHCTHKLGRNCAALIAKQFHNPTRKISEVYEHSNLNAQCPYSHCKANFTLYDKLDTQGVLFTIKEIFIKIYKLGVVDGLKAMELWNSVAPIFALLNVLDRCSFGTLTFIATLCGLFIHWVGDEPYDIVVLTILILLGWKVFERFSRTLLT